MSKVRYGEHEFELIDPDRVTWAEYEHVEKLAKQKYDDWSSLMRTRAVLFVSLRRHDHRVLTWQQFAETSSADFEGTEEPTDAAGAEQDDEDEPDPT